MVQCVLWLPYTAIITQTVPVERTRMAVVSSIGTDVNQAAATTIE